MSGQFTTFWQIPAKKNNYNYVKGQFSTIWQIPDKTKNYHHVSWQFTTFWQIPDKKMSIMREGKLLPIDRFQTNIIIKIMCEGNLLYFDRFPKKKIITKKFTNYNNFNVRGQFTTFWQIPEKKLQLCERANYSYWQIPDKYNNYNYVRGQFTTFWQIPDKKNNYNYARGQFTTFWQIPDKKIITIMWEAIYYLLTDSRQKK